METKTDDKYIQQLTQVNAKTNQKILFNNNTCDMIKICTIIIPNNINFSSTINLIIGYHTSKTSCHLFDTKVFKIPLPLLCMLSDTCKIGNKICIKINDYLMGLVYSDSRYDYSLLLRSLYDSDLYIMLSSEYEFEYDLTIQKQATHKYQNK